MPRAEKKAVPVSTRRPGGVLKGVEDSNRIYFGCALLSAGVAGAGALFCADAGASVPLVISLTSTRRFSWRPEAEPFEAAGLSFPNPTM